MKSSIQLQLRVLRCQAGDREAFSELYAEFSPRIFRFIRGIVGSPDVADVHQDVWAAVFQGIGALSKPSAFVTWVFRLARFKAIDRIRRDRTRAGDIEDADLPRIEMEERLQSEIDIELGLSKLSPTHRAILLLRYWEDLSYEQIAVVTDTPLGTVKSRLDHAHRNLEEHLNPTESHKTNTGERK